MLPLEYVIIGAGPAGICAVAKLVGSGIPGNKILWIDPKFTVGDFGSKLIAGSSVPGNTTVESYQAVNKAIYGMIPLCRPAAEIEDHFAITHLSKEYTCSLKIAAEPLRYISDQLRTIVQTIKGKVSDIEQDTVYWKLSVQQGVITQSLFSQRVIITTGAIPKTLSLPTHLQVIDPYIGFIQTELKNFLTENSVQKVAVIGSSHSAALAVMHLLEAGIAVKQFMKHDYKFAEQRNFEGVSYTQFDNTGLKGIVAQFTRELLAQKESGVGKYSTKWDRFIGDNVDWLIDTYTIDCTHAIVCIGFKTINAFEINDRPLSLYSYDEKTSQIQGVEGIPMPGLFVIGIGHPKKVKAISGEEEYAVGVGKFWKCLDVATLELWKNNTLSLTQERHSNCFFSIGQTALELYPGIKALSTE